MDITLERILSLIPRKDDGKFVHGALKQFAQSIGYDGGEIVTMWINGSSESYKKKLHEISDKYGVSVEWLKGETDIKEKPTAEAMSFEGIKRAVKGMSREQLIELAIAIAQEQGER